MSERLPAHLEVAGLIRNVEGAGGFAAVLHKGEREAGTILLVLTENGTHLRLFERLPDPERGLVWTQVSNQLTENNEEMSDYLARRSTRDPDLWIVELDIVDGERFIRSSSSMG